MQRLKGRNIVFGALAVLACSGDPTGNESTPTAIQSNPDVVFVTQGDSQPVIVQVLDEDGGVLQADFTATNVGNGITVRLDPTYQQVTTGNPINRGARFFVTGVDLTKTSFTVNALGLSRTIEVTSVPGELDATITDSLPELGDTISLTAPTGTFFTDSSVVTFNGAAPVVVSQDATTITFIPMANITGPALVSNVGVESNPAVVFDLTTPFAVKTDSIIDIGTGISNQAPNLGDPITLTLPAGLKLLPESLVTLSIAGNGVLPRNRTLSADSSVITFTPPPNADSFVVVSGVVPAPLAACCGATEGYPLLLSTTAKVKTPVIDSVPANLSSPTPAANDEVTVTITDGAFTPTDTANVLVGAAPTTIVGRTANSLTFVPPPGAAGNVTINGVDIAGFALALPAKAPPITVGALTPLAGTNREATAPALPVPGAGDLTTFYDQPDLPAGFGDPVADLAGGGGSAFYKLNIPSAGDYTITMNWDIGSDLDVFVCDSPIDAVALSNCDFTAATGDQPESATFTLTAGTHIIVINDFGGDAAGATLQFTIEH
ncbi:MAG TPA: hypothetical protein VJQ44_15305 [Gemmatimonadales bacterium]|nr:hypothetical protein [Gemmatimonadales bacterium]